MLKKTRENSPTTESAKRSKQVSTQFTESLVTSTVQLYNFVIVEELTMDDLCEAIADGIDGMEIEGLTRKVVLERAEAAMGVEPGALLPRKEDVYQAFNALLYPESDDEDGGQEERDTEPTASGPREEAQGPPPSPVLYLLPGLAPDAPSLGAAEVDATGGEELSRKEQALEARAISRMQQLAPLFDEDEIKEGDDADMVEAKRHARAAYDRFFKQGDFAVGGGGEAPAGADASPSTPGVISRRLTAPSGALGVAVADLSA